MNTAWTVDWISMTFKTGVKEIDLRKAVSFGMPLKTWSEMQAMFGYSHAMVHPFGHYIMTNPGRPEMGIHLGMTGRSLRALQEQGRPGAEMISWAIEQGARPSRLDLAIDVFDVEIDPIALASAPRVKEAPGTARKWESVRGHNGGATAYIGSRKSERFLRVYDKRVQTGSQGGPWTRFEIELKGNAARAAALQMHLLSDLERPVFIAGLIKSLFNPDDAVFQEAMNAEAVLLKTEKDTHDKTLEWLLNSVPKTLAKTMKARGDVDVWNQFIAQVHANLLALGVEFSEL